MYAVLNSSHHYSNCCTVQATTNYESLFIIRTPRLIFNCIIELAAELTQSGANSVALRRTMQINS